MTQLSIRVEGAELVRQGLQDLEAEIPKVGRLQIYRTMQAIQKRLKAYWVSNSPPAMPTYQRTGRLASGYTLTGIPNGYTLSNTVPYTQYVVGNAYGLNQSWVHARPGRHQLWRDIQDDEVSKLPREIDEAIVVVARRLRFEASTEAFGL